MFVCFIFFIDLCSMYNFEFKIVQLEGYIICTPGVVGGIFKTEKLSDWLQKKCFETMVPCRQNFEQVRETKKVMNYKKECVFLKIIKVTRVAKCFCHSFCHNIMRIVGPSKGDTGKTINNFKVGRFVKWVLCIRFHSGESGLNTCGQGNLK